MNPLPPLALVLALLQGFPDDTGAMMAAKDWQRLRPLALAQVQADPKDRLGWRMLGLCEAARQDREGTLRCARRLQALRPGDGASFLKEPAVAAALFQEASLSPLDPSRIAVKSRPPVPLAPALFREEGVAVLLDMVIDADGLPLRVRALTSSPDLSAAAEAYAVQWVLEPLPDRKPGRFLMWVLFRTESGAQAFNPRAFDPLGLQLPSLASWAITGKNRFVYVHPALVGERHSHAVRVMAKEQ